MKRTPRMFALSCAACLLLASAHSDAEGIRIAVASNFRDPMRTLVAEFETRTGHRVVVSFSSTGKHYAQIRNGAAYDAFFAADAGRPERLERDGIAVPGSRFAYAVGRLVLWSPQRDVVDPDGRVLERGAFRFLAIANPTLAPYGLAAREVLQALGLWEQLQGRIVRAENVSQAFQYVMSGNADLGLLAYSHVKDRAEQGEGSIWEIPRALYSPIEQQAVLLSDREEARAFLLFVRGEEALKIIRDYGYDVP